VSAGIPPALSLRTAGVPPALSAVREQELATDFRR
jgi:hypothetical protein